MTTVLKYVTRKELRERREQSCLSPEETMIRFIDQTNQTCLVALDKSLAAIRLSPSLTAAATRVGCIGERMLRASSEVGLSLPVETRASAPRY